MKIAIIGAHPQETKALYDNLSQRFSIIELAACSDPDMSAAEHMAEQYGIPALPIDEILQDPEIRIILNATFAGDTEQITERFTPRRRSWQGTTVLSQRFFPMCCSPEEACCMT